MSNYRIGQHVIVILDDLHLGPKSTGSQFGQDARCDGIVVAIESTPHGTRYRIALPMSAGGVNTVSLGRDRIVGCP